MGFFNDFMDCDGSEFGFHNVPDHIDPITGHYMSGTRKCSHCKVMKTKSDFTKEEAKKSAARRLCNNCISSGDGVKKTRRASTRPAASAASASLPDISSMKIKDMKQELESYGVCTKTILEKSDLITALVDARKEKLPTHDTITIEYIKSLKVADLKVELKARGCPTSGLKADLQQRLAGAAGLSLGTAEEEEMMSSAHVKKRAKMDARSLRKTNDKTNDKTNVRMEKKVTVQKTATAVKAAKVQKSRKVSTHHNTNKETGSVYYDVPGSQGDDFRNRPFSPDNVKLHTQNKKITTKQPSEDDIAKHFASVLNRRIGFKKNEENEGKMTGDKNAISKESGTASVSAEKPSINEKIGESISTACDGMKGKDTDVDMTGTNTTKLQNNNGTDTKVACGNKTVSTSASSANSAEMQKEEFLSYLDDLMSNNTTQKATKKKNIKRPAPTADSSIPVEEINVHRTNGKQEVNMKASADSFNRLAFPEQINTRSNGMKPVGQDKKRGCNTNGQQEMQSNNKTHRMKRKNDNVKSSATISVSKIHVKEVVPHSNEQHEVKKKKIDASVNAKNNWYYQRSKKSSINDTNEVEKKRDIPEKSQSVNHESTVGEERLNLRASDNPEPNAKIKSNTQQIKDEQTANHASMIEINSVADKENNCPNANLNMGKVHVPESHATTKKIKSVAQKVKLWRMIAPEWHESRTKTNDQGQTFYWCAKCQLWTASHLSEKHVGKKKPNRNRRKRDRNGKNKKPLQHSVMA